MRFADGNRLLDSTYDFAVVDSNSFPFVFKYAPEVAKELHISSEFSFETATLSQRETWVVCDYNVSSQCYIEYINWMVLYDLDSQTYRPFDVKLLIANFVK